MSIVRPTPTRGTLSHLLLAGHNPLSPPLVYAARSRQSPSNPTLTPAPLSSWLGSIGRASDVASGWSILPSGLASGLEHNLFSYRSQGVDRCFAVGRNEVGQLGLGFNSQEGTRGLVEGFEGEEVLQAVASVQSSYLLLRRQDSTALYAWGSLQRGRLGQPAFYAPSERTPDDHEPELHMLSKATLVDLPPEIKGIKQLATGFEHLLLLTDSGEVYGTGCNTDGQLGLGSEVVTDVYELRKMELPREIAAEGGIAKLRAGADTSALVTASGKVWTWGNSEYAQGLHGRKVDQIHSPTEIDSSFLPSSRRIVDFRCGGSFSLILDNRGSVYSAGFGALGLGPTTLESQLVRRIDSLEGQGVNRIRAGWGWASAIRGTASSLWTWGLNNAHGRLGVGTVASASPPTLVAAAKPPTVSMHVYEPTELVLPLQELGLAGEEAEWSFGEVECGEEALWVGLIATEPVAA